MQIAQAKQCDSLRMIPGSKFAIEIFTPCLRGKAQIVPAQPAAMGPGRAVDHAAECALAAATGTLDPARLKGTRETNRVQTHTASMAALHPVWPAK
jgi:hypothetical protein